MNLNGWDAVFAIAGASVNAALAAQGDKLLTTFSFQQPVAASGTYGAWQISAGSAGTLLQLQITIENGTYQTNSGAVDLTGAVVLLQVALALLPDADGNQHLVFDLAPGIVTFVSLAGLPAIGSIEATALGLAIADDLSARANVVSFVLASVSPVSGDGPTWLSPNETAFAYVTPTGGAPVLAIFAKTTACDISQFSRTIDPGLLGGGTTALAIAPALFMANVFAPALAQSLGTATSSFEMTSAAELQATGSFALPSVEKAGEHYHPQIDTLSATLVDDRVNVALTGNCDMHLGISLTFSGSSSIGADLGSAASLTFVTLGTPSFTHDLAVPWYVHLLDIITWVAELIIDVTTAAISKALANGVSQFAQSSAIAAQAPSIVGWVGSAAFTPTSAGLADCLWLQGNQ